MWSASFLPIQSMWALALLMELGPHKDRGKLWPGWELNSRPSGWITAAPPTETQSQTGAGRGNWRCQFHGNEYVQLSTRKGYVFVANVSRVALIVWTNSMTSSQGFIRPRNQPRSQGLSSPHPKGSEVEKDPGSGWSRVFVTNLSSWEGFQFIKVLSPLLFATS